MIYPNSRYVDAPISIVTDFRGTHQSVDVQTPLDRSFTFSFYTVENGDTAEWLGYEFLGDGTLWWIIADANPEILDWHDLTPGTVLRIPSV